MQAPHSDYIQLFGVDKPSLLNKQRLTDQHGVWTTHSEAGLADFLLHACVF